MCYSVILEQEIDKLITKFGADVDFNLILDIAHERTRERIEKGDIPPRKIALAKAFEDNFREPKSEMQARIKAEIDLYNSRSRQKWETELFEQRKRHADAARKLAVKDTKKAQSELRVSASKIKQRMRWLAELSREKPDESDGRIYPKDYAPVIVVENGRKIIKPMRYHCRPFGFPADVDCKFEGCYNARRDTIEKNGAYWRNIFGRHHGIVVAYTFFEHVPTWRLEKRPEPSDPEEANKSTEIRFEPQTHAQMHFACVWDRWKDPEGKEPDLLSFAIVTDDPPPEVAAAGHDRCPIPIKFENIDAWLTPEGRTREDLFAILDDRERPYYEHQLARAA